MRDPKRIDRIIRKLGIIWRKHPDLRLMQLLGNCFPSGDHYYKEDSDLEEGLHSVYNACLSQETIPEAPLNVEEGTEGLE